ncbi:MAG: alkaline phosphatase family protein, partial [Gemmatimonadaceae bacterium]|nr:alkaline phosphatase family protein [Gemmatimonadaceae bacterium]
MWAPQDEGRVPGYISHGDAFPPGLMSVVVLVADGARPDTFASEIDSGRLPALARMRDEGGMHAVTSAFPSVTGPAYAPF